MPSGARSKARPDGKPFTWSSPETPTNRTVAPLPAPGTSSNVNGRAPSVVASSRSCSRTIRRMVSMSSWASSARANIRRSASCCQGLSPPAHPIISSNNGISVSFPDPPIKGRAQLDGKWPAPSRCFAVFRLPAFLTATLVACPVVTLHGQNFCMLTSIKPL